MSFPVLDRPHCAEHASRPKASGTQGQCASRRPAPRTQLAAGVSALRIEGGDITLTTPGPARFRAAMKELSGAAASSAPALRLNQAADLITPDEALHSIQFNAIDLIGANAEGAAAMALPYEFRSLDGAVLLRGYTDPHGNTGRLHAKQPLHGHLYLGDGVIKWSLDVAHEEPEHE